MKKHSKLMLILLALVMLAQCFTACKNDTPPAGSSEAETTEAPAPTELMLIGGDTVYNIIRSSYEEEPVLNAIKTLRQTITKLYGDVWQGLITEDWEQGVGKDDIIDNDNAEILIGVTNRRESHTVYESLGEDEYAIRVVGKKLVIVGSDEYATAEAVNVFTEGYVAGGATGATGMLKVDVALDVKGTASLRKVQINSEAKYRIMTWNLGCEVGNVDDALEVMLKYLPDILSLQECNKAIHTKLINRLPKFYQVSTRFHSNGKTYVYTPIIYNSEVLTLKEAGVEWLRDRYTKTNTKSLAWAVFEDKEGAQFAVIDFHGAVCSNAYKGYENYTRAQLNEQSSVWRTGNVKQVLEVRERIFAKYGDIPLMVNGDCNFTSTSTQYKQITDSGMYDAEFTARLGTVTGFKTYFDYGTPIKTGPSIDHIFGVNGIDFVEHYIVRDKLVLTASDHCPVYVDFNPKKP